MSMGNYSFFTLFESLLIFLGSMSFDGYSLPNFSAQLFDGGVSHIVAAALETKGLIDQSKILKNLTTLNELAGFFYFFSIIMAVGAVAVFGTYRQGLYFLIGPALYFFMVTQTTETNGVKAKLGEYEIPNSVSRQSQFLSNIKAISPEEGGKAEVSLFFATIDGIVSEIIGQITALLLDTKNREHLKIEGRERVLNYIMMTYPPGSAIPQMIARHQGECANMMSEYYAAGKDTKNDVHQRFRDQLEAERLRNEANKKWGQSRISLTAKDTDIKTYLLAMKGQPGFPSDYGVTDEKDEMIFTCQGFWQLIAASLRQVAKKALDPDYYKGAEEKDDYQPKAEEYQDTIEFLRTPFNGASEEDVLAAQVYKNVLANTTHGALASQIFTNAPFNAKEFNVAYKDIPGAESRGAFFSLRYIATSIPYIQGLLLYMLAVAFPFFAVLLVIPGRAVSFLVWCSLWVWVKSWDLGFAVVLVMRDLFWHMLKFRQNTFKNTLELEDPFSVYGVILNNDPLATMNTYWELAFAMTIAVPFLTAHFCLGATNMFDMFKNGIDQTVGRFRQFETNAGKREIANQLEASRAEADYRVATAFMNDMLRQAPADNSNHGGGALNRRGLQTSDGKPIAWNTDQNKWDVAEYGMRVANARQAQAMVGFKVARMLNQVGTKDFMNTMMEQRDQIENLEDRVRESLGGQSQGTYALPQGVRSSEDLGKNVSPEVIEAAYKEYEKKIQLLPDNQQEKAREQQFDLSKNYTYEEFIEKHAVQRGEHVQMSSLMRGVTHLSSEVSREAMGEMFGIRDKNGGLVKGADGEVVLDKNFEMVRKYESQGNVSWSDVFEYSQDNQKDHFAAIAATVGRRYMPATQLVHNAFQEANLLSENVSQSARTALSSESAGISNQFTMPGFEHLVTGMHGWAVGSTPGVAVVDPTRPGIDSSKEAPTGDVSNNPKITTTTAN